jgi:hypothetical protein
MSQHARPQRAGEKQGGRRKWCLRIVGDPDVAGLIRTGKSSCGPRSAFTGTYREEPECARTRT